MRQVSSSPIPMPGWRQRAGRVGLRAWAATAQIATQGENARGAASGRPSRNACFEAWRSYYDYLPRGRTTLQYTLRLNNAGHFALPPSRVEAMYAPEMFGETPNPPLTVEASR
jgi:hypothetical protein